MAKTLPKTRKTPKKTSLRKRLVNNMMQEQDYSDDLCQGEYSKSGPKRLQQWEKNRKHNIVDFDVLMCLIKGVKNVCMVLFSEKSKISSSDREFLNAIIQLSNESGVKCLMENGKLNGQHITAIYAFLPGYFESAMILMFFDKMGRNYIDHDQIYESFYGNVDIKYNDVKRYQLINWYNFGKTLGYKSEYIKNFYIFVLNEYLSEKDAIKIYERDRQMYPITIKKIKKCKIFIRLVEKHKSRIREIPISGELF